MDIIKNFFNQFGEQQRPMAASVQSLECCMQIIQSTKVNSILDSGSGLSTAVFHSTFNNVTTVDDNLFWANKTKTFVASALKKDIEIPQLTDIGDQKFDFVFYDYGNMESRIYHFKKALSMCNRFFYIDDMHVTYYREYINAKYSNYNLIYLPQTIDEFGRYGALIRI